MEFGIRLILPDRTGRTEEVRLPVWDKTSELIDDDPNRPLFLVKAGDVFAANGVRFEISGFFAEPLPTSTDDSFVEFMEQLPDFLNYLATESAPTHSVSLWEQGVETEFSFLRLKHDHLVEVGCSTRTSRVLAKRKERIKSLEILSQVIAFISSYREALERYMPALIQESWNQELFALASRLGTAGAAGLGTSSAQE